MSIESLIRDRVGRGMLFPIRPRAAGTAPHRAMFASEQVWSTLTDDYEDEDMEARMGALQADLELVVTGMPIDPKYLFLLYPSYEGVWEVRSTRPQPSIRVVGQFAARDVFIATNIALREALGGWQSREWKTVKRAAHACWRRLFDPYRPLRSIDARDLATGVLDGRYFKA